MSPFTKHNVDNELLVQWGKMVGHFQRIINWSEVSPFKKHYVDNEVLMLWKNSHKLLKNNQLECSATFHKP